MLLLLFWLCIPMTGCGGQSSLYILLLLFIGIDCGPGCHPQIWIWEGG